MNEFLQDESAETGVEAFALEREAKPPGVVDLLEGVGGDQKRRPGDKEAVEALWQLYFNAVKVQNNREESTLLRDF